MLYKKLKKLKKFNRNRYKDFDKDFDNDVDLDEDLDEDLERSIHLERSITVEKDYEINLFNYKPLFRCTNCRQWIPINSKMHCGFGEQCCNNCYWTVVEEWNIKMVVKDVKDVKVNVNVNVNVEIVGIDVW
jgi:hypothetical protein